jgi:hypothetical protein
MIVSLLWTTIEGNTIVIVLIILIPSLYLSFILMRSSPPKRKTLGEIADEKEALARQHYTRAALDRTVQRHDDPMFVHEWLNGLQNFNIPHTVTATTNVAADVEYQPYEPQDSDDFYYPPGDFVPLQTSLEFTYTNFAGMTARCQVDVQQIGCDEQMGYISGFCHYRQARRTFRLNRISECVELDTGEQLSDLLSYLRERYKTGPHKRCLEIIEGHSSALEMLAVLGKLDGALRAK